jgi:hypothetical protein
MFCVACFAAGLDFKMSKLLCGIQRVKWHINIELQPPFV